MRLLHTLPSSGIGHNDSIVDGKGVSGQSGDVPGPDFDGLTQSAAQTEVTTARDLTSLNRTKKLMCIFSKIIYMYMYIRRTWVHM